MAAPSFRLFCLLLSMPVALVAQRAPDRLASDYCEAVEAWNRAHAERPRAKSEEQLADALPAAAKKLVDALLAADDSPATRAALATMARAALDIACTEDFERLRARLLELDAAAAAEFPIALARPRFLAIGEDGVAPEGLTAIADVFDLVLDAYEEVFGLTNFSKVPGKKLRLRVHLEAKIERPPHFAPQFPFHSEIDFPVVDAREFRSPTADGKFLFYGLCHELGHVIAMWGDRQNEEDRHAWAHYTGIVVVEHLSESKKSHRALADLRDGRWRSLTFEKKQLAAKKVTPGPKDADTVLARFVALHEAVGPKVIGEALAALDGAGKHTLINRVRYYSMRDFEAALRNTKPGRAKKKSIDAAFADG